MTLQTLDRAIALIAVIGQHQAEGLRLVDAQRLLALSKPTAHRLLTTLAAHDYIVQDDSTRRYRLSQGLAILSRSIAQSLPDFRELCYPSALRLAEATGDTIVVVMRSGLDTVCMVRVSGAYPIKALTLDVGTRRPLGVGAGGLAILAAMAPSESADIVRSLQLRIAAYQNASQQKIGSAVRAARVKGFSFSDGHVETGVRGIAVAIMDGPGIPVAALGVSAIASRIPDKRMRALVGLLNTERLRIEKILREARVGPKR